MPRLAVPRLLVSRLLACLCAALAVSAATLVFAADPHSIVQSGRATFFCPGCQKR